MVVADSPDNDLFSHIAVREAQGLRAGGFGLLLAKHLVGDLIYSEQGNDVLLIKYVETAASQAAMDYSRVGRHPANYRGIQGMGCDSA